jgi:hypothetical protein
VCILASLDLAKAFDTIIREFVCAPVLLLETQLDLNQNCSCLNSWNLFGNFKGCRELRSYTYVHDPIPHETHETRTVKVIQTDGHVCFLLSSTECNFNKQLLERTFFMLIPRKKLRTVYRYSVLSWG